MKLAIKSQSFNLSFTGKADIKMVRIGAITKYQITIDVILFAKNEHVMVFSMKHLSSE